MRKEAILVGLILLAAGCPVQAKEQCSIQAVGGNDLWIVSRKADICDVRKVVTPKHDCRIWLKPHHGYRGFQCGDDFGGQWGAADLGFQGAAVTTIGTNRKVKLPEHSHLRKTWLAPIDQEGLTKGYPVDMDDYIDYYPRRFTAIGARIDLENPELKTAIQTLRYVTMKGQQRAAVTGEASFECLKLHFFTWVDPTKMDVTEQDMAAFLKDLRLEPVTETSKRRDWVCQRLN
jgi:hypothetical protein